MRISHSTVRNGFFITALVCTASIPTWAQGGFAGPGWYQITNVKTGGSLTLAPDGRSVVQEPPRGNENQVWAFEPAQGGFFFIRNGGNGFALEPTAGQNSSIVLAAPFHGGPSQQWRLEPGKDGNALIVNSYGRTLDIPDGDQRRGVVLQIYDRNGDSNQRFIIAPAQGQFGSRWRRPVGGPLIVNCASDDGRRRYCEIDGTANVRLSRQISGSACREGETWGRDARGIWVDRGCRAEFEVVVGPPRDMGRDSGRRDDRPREEDIVRCSSDGRRTYCDADTRGGVRLLRQFEGRECRQGESWGFDRRCIWVDRGCRGEFVLIRR